MMLKPCLFLVSLLLVGGAFGADVELWKGCVNLSGEICAKLMNTPPCGLRMVVTYGGLPIMDEPMDIAISNQVCKDLLGSTYCFQLQNLTVANDGQVHPCIYLKITTGGSTTINNLGCLTSPNTLAQCLAQGCPNGCSGHGTCDPTSHKCSCSNGWYGDDCSLEEPLYQQCQVVAPYGTVCLTLKIEDCGIDVSVDLTPQSIPTSLQLYHQLISAPAFNTYFLTSFCSGGSIAGLTVQACVAWNNFVLNTTYARGCPAMNVTIAGMTYAYQYTCFEDDSLVPACFGPCPKNCSGNGACVNGACSCYADYTGNTCADPYCKFGCGGNGECVAPNQCACNDGWGGSACESASCTALNDCNGHGSCNAPNLCACFPGYTGSACAEITCSTDCGHGTCVSGTCKCDDGYKGDSCSQKVDTGVTPSGVYVAVGVVLGVVIAGAGGAGAFVLWKRKRQQNIRAFSSFDDGLIQVPSSPDDTAEDGAIN